MDAGPKGSDLAAGRMRIIGDRPQVSARGHILKHLISLGKSNMNELLQVRTDGPRQVANAIPSDRTLKHPL